MSTVIFLQEKTYSIKEMVRLLSREVSCFINFFFEKHGIAAITVNNALNVISELTLNLNANRSLKYS